MELSHILYHLGEDRKKYYNAVCPPIIQSSNFVFDDLNSFREAIGDESKHTIYTRGNNPTVTILRKKLAALEKSEDALVMGSGSAAIAAAVVSNVKAGDHIVCIQSPYSWTYKLLTNILTRFGVSHTFVDGTKLEAIEEAIQPNTTLLYLESPNSLTFELQDLTACAELAKKNGLITIIDNSYASPIFQQPITHGIDIVIHSGTKYLNGHSDVVVGIICSSKKLIKKIFDDSYMTLGAIISPSDAALVLRGLRTLELRMQRSFKSCEKIVSYLSNHLKVEQIYYPFLPTFPQYNLAKKQMNGTGGLFSIQVKADHITQVEDFFHRLERFLLAVSWGGHESLVLPICGLYNIKGKENPSLPWNLLRFYIGLEDPDWLIEDLDNAFKALP